MVKRIKWVNHKKHRDEHNKHPINIAKRKREQSQTSGWWQNYGKWIDFQLDVIV